MVEVETVNYSKAAGADAHTLQNWLSYNHSQAREFKFTNQSSQKSYTRLNIYDFVVVESGNIADLETN